MRHHRPGGACVLVGERDGGDLRRSALQKLGREMGEDVGEDFDEALDEAGADGGESDGTDLD